MSYGTSTVSRTTACSRPSIALVSYVIIVTAVVAAAPGPLVTAACVVVVVVVSVFKLAKLAKLALALVIIAIVVVVEGEGERAGTPCHAVVSPFHSRSCRCIRTGVHAQRNVLPLAGSPPREGGSRSHESPPRHHGGHQGLSTWDIPGVNAGGVHPAVDPALTLSGVNTPVHAL